MDSRSKTEAFQTLDDLIALVALQHRRTPGFELLRLQVHADLRKFSWDETIMIFAEATNWLRINYPANWCALMLHTMGKGPKQIMQACRHILAVKKHRRHSRKKTELPCCSCWQYFLNLDFSLDRIDHLIWYGGDLLIDRVDHIIAARLRSRRHT